MSLFSHEFHEDSSDEFGTPAEFHRPIADAVGGFDLDPASGAESQPLASTRYTEEDDGLSREWFGNVWLNPPFSEKTKWVRNTRAEVAEGNVETAVVLLPVDTSTKLFHNHVNDASAICFVEGRLSFDGGDRNPNFGVLLAVFGELFDDLLDVLDRKGTVFRVDEKHERAEQQELLTDGGVVQTDDDEVLACPECDKTPVVTNSTGARNDGEYSKYRCPTCNAHFDEPKVREDRGGPGIRDDSLAAKLDEADPSDLVTDGGVDQDDGGVDRHGRQAGDPDEFRADSVEVDTFDPGLALGYLRRLEVLLDACPVNIYAASSLKHPWPYRLQNAAECYPASFWRSQDRIMDSAIGEDLTNNDVLDHAVERHATAVVAKDYLNDQRSTTESIREFVNLHDSESHPRAYIPLQPPYDEHITEVYPIIDESHLDHRYMLGGLATAPPAERIKELVAFRREVGEGPIAHGLGWGLGDDLVATIRDEPALLDSVDNSSPAQAAQNGQILDKHWRARDCPNVDGRYQNSVHGAFEFAMLVQATHRMTQFNDDFETVNQQANLAEFGGVRADD